MTRDNEPGLRERKKVETRKLLSEVAMRLFVTRGFDEVTVADVAAEAGVSEKTVFNYFATKEDLVLGGRAASEEALLRTIRERAPGTSILEAVRGHTHAVAARMASLSVEKRLAFKKLVTGSPTINARMRQMSAEHQDAVARLVADEIGGHESDPLPRTIAGTLGVLSHLAYCGITGWTDTKRRSDREVEAVIDEAFALFRDGLSGLGVRR